MLVFVARRVDDCMQRQSAPVYLPVCLNFFLYAYLVLVTETGLDNGSLCRTV